MSVIAGMAVMAGMVEIHHVRKLLAWNERIRA